MTLNDLERPKRTLLQKRCVCIVSGNIRYTCACAHSRGSSWRWPQMRVGLSTTAFFGDLSDYFFENFRYKASSIIWRYATPCLPVIDCKMSDLEWPRAGLFHVKNRFRIALPDSEWLTFKNNCVKSNKHIPILHVRSGASGVPSKLG